MTAPASPARPNLLRYQWRAWRLKCPRCGGGSLFSGLFRMQPKCPNCGLVYQRGPGYFLGSIYINYGLTALLVTLAYVVFGLMRGIHSPWLTWSLAAFCVLFPVLFFRYSRALWLAFDLYWDPPRRRAEPRDR